MPRSRRLPREIVASRGTTVFALALSLASVSLGGCSLVESFDGYADGTPTDAAAPRDASADVGVVDAGSDTGTLADAMGRKNLMALSGVLFVASIPMIALSHGYGALVLGRLLQGISAGLIGVVIPLYLAECLSKDDRGKGTGIFQWLLTLGIVTAAAIGIYFSVQVDAVAKLGDAAQLLAYKDAAWRRIFWVSLPPGVLFVIGSFMVAESPRWLYRRGKIDAARTALLRSRTEEQTEIELKEMAATIAAEQAGSTSGTGGSGSLLI